MHPETGLLGLPNPVFSRKSNNSSWNLNSRHLHFPEGSPLAPKWTPRPTRYIFITRTPSATFPATEPNANSTANRNLGKKPAINSKRLRKEINQQLECIPTHSGSPNISHKHPRHTTLLFLSVDRTFHTPCRRNERFGTSPGSFKKSGPAGAATTQSRTFRHRMYT